MAAVCKVCGEKLPAGSRTCLLCGSKVTRLEFPSATSLAADEPVAPVTPTAGAVPDLRRCPACGRLYGNNYPDSFCMCGGELVVPEARLEAPAIRGEEGAVEEEQAGPAAAEPERPPPGTACLVLYGPQKQPLHYFSLTKDVTLIGRSDAVSGSFPDIDLAAWLDPAQARRVSRKHALVFRSRADRRCWLRPLAGNTGTQIEADMVPALADYPLAPGLRIIFGGAVRFKFEVM